MQKQKILLVIIDGLGDRPDEQLNYLTPLEAARTPYLNYMAERGITGTVNTIGVGVCPGSDTAHMALLGYDPNVYYHGRGPFEAAGAGIKLKQGDVAFRVNFATLDSKGRIIDRRAGRIDSVVPFEAALSKIKVPGYSFVFKPTVNHRGALVVRGVNLSHNISENDPHDVGLKEHEIKATDGKENSINTANVLNEYLRQARKILSTHPINKKRAKQKLPLANTMLVRGAGEAYCLPSFGEKYRLSAACIAGGALYKGIASTLGMDLISVNGATGRKDTNVLAKALAARAALEKYDFVFMHVKGTDSYAEDGDAVGKKAFIERIDAAMKELLTLDNTIIAITGDHTTVCQLKAHSGDPVPLLVYGRGVRKDAVKKFGERDCATGGMGRIMGLQLMPELINLSGRAEKFGS